MSQLVWLTDNLKELRELLFPTKILFQLQVEFYYKLYWEHLVIVVDAEERNIVQFIFNISIRVAEYPILGFHNNIVFCSGSIYLGLAFTVGLKPWIEQNTRELFPAVWFSLFLCAFSILNNLLLVLLIVTFLWSGICNLKDGSLVLANIPDQRVKDQFSFM